MALWKLQLTIYSHTKRVFDLMCTNLSIHKKRNLEICPLNILRNLMVDAAKRGGANKEDICQQ
jgi:hypothetical protein